MCDSSLSERSDPIRPPSRRFITGSSRWADADTFESWALRQGASKLRFVDARAILDAGKVVISAEDARGLVTATAVGALPAQRRPPAASSRWRSLRRLLETPLYSIARLSSQPPRFVPGSNGEEYSLRLFLPARDNQAPKFECALLPGLSHRLISLLLRCSTHPDLIPCVPLCPARRA